MLKKVIIFTVGYHARATWRALSKRTDVKMIAFVDNAPETQGHELFGLPVLAPSVIPDLEYDYIAVPGRSQTEISEQLKKEFSVSSECIWFLTRNEIRPSVAEIAQRGEQIRSLLSCFLKVVCAANVQYWALHSTLIGLLRGDDLAVFSDIDLCFDSTQGETLATMLTREWEHDFSIRLSRHGSEKEETIKQIVISAKGENNDLFEPGIIDFIPIQIRDDFATWESNHQTLTLPPSLFSSFLEYEYRGIPIRCPLNAEMIVEKLYGQSWRKPVDTWNGTYACHINDPKEKVLFV